MKRYVRVDVYNFDNLTDLTEYERTQPRNREIFMSYGDGDLESLAKHLGYRVLDESENVEIIFHTKIGDEKAIVPIEVRKNPKVRIKMLKIGDSFTYDGIEYVKVGTYDGHSSLVVYKNPGASIPVECWSMKLSEVSITRILSDIRVPLAKYEKLREIFKHPCIRLSSDFYVEKT